MLSELTLGFNDFFLPPAGQSCTCTSNHKVFLRVTCVTQHVFLHFSHAIPPLHLPSNSLKRLTVWRTALAWFVQRLWWFFFCAPLWSHMSNVASFFRFIFLLLSLVRSLIAASRHFLPLRFSRLVGAEKEKKKCADSNVLQSYYFLGWFKKMNSEKWQNASEEISFPFVVFAKIVRWIKLMNKIQKCSVKSIYLK